MGQTTAIAKFFAMNLGYATGSVSRRVLAPCSSWWTSSQRCASCSTPKGGDLTVFGLGSDEEPVGRCQESMDFPAADESCMTAGKTSIG